MSDAPVEISAKQLMERLGQLESELSVLLEQSDHLQRLATIGTMAAGVVHEVNNLLTPALAYAQLADREPDDRAVQRKAVASSLVGIQAAVEILQAVLEFSSAADPRAAADVSETLRRAMACLGRDLGRDQIDLRVAVPDGLVAAIKPLSLQQILLNLLLNAARELRARSGGKITIEAVRRGSQIRITVSDNGPGVPPTMRETVFQPFVTGGAPVSDDDRRGGSGLGLAMARRMVESHGGSISLSETPGGGATFSVTLLVAAEAAAAAA